MFQFKHSESFSEREERVLKLWKETGAFQKSVDERKDRPLFAFYDGPPFATGLPHYGHLLAGTIKDAVPRYKTMKGFYVPRFPMCRHREHSTGCWWLGISCHISSTSTETFTECDPPPVMMPATGLTSSKSRP